MPNHFLQAALAFVSFASAGLVLYLIVHFTLKINLLRKALLDANAMCRSSFQVAQRIATEHTTHALGTNFGALADRLEESLKRQDGVIQATGGYPTWEEE